MHPVTHFVSAIAVAYFSNDIHTLLRLFSWDGLVYVCYVSIPPTTARLSGDKSSRFDAAVGWLASRLVPTAASVSGYLVADLSGLLLLFNRLLGCWLCCAFDPHGSIFDTSLRSALRPRAAGWPG